MLAFQNVDIVSIIYKQYVKVNHVTWHQNQCIVGIRNNYIIISSLRLNSINLYKSYYLLSFLSTFFWLQNRIKTQKTALNLCYQIKIVHFRILIVPKIYCLFAYDWIKGLNEDACKKEHTSSVLTLIKDFFV